VIAAIIITGLFGTVLVIRRQDVLTVATGVALLAVGASWDAEVTFSRLHRADARA
jgi:hypothetical protein